MRVIMCHKNIFNWICIWNDHTERNCSNGVFKPFQVYFRCMKMSTFFFFSLMSFAMKFLISWLDGIIFYIVFASLTFNWNYWEREKKTHIVNQLEEIFLWRNKKNTHTHWFDNKIVCEATNLKSMMIYFILYLPIALLIKRYKRVWRLKFGLYVFKSIKCRHCHSIIIFISCLFFFF